MGIRLNGGLKFLLTHIDLLLAACIILSNSTHRYWNQFRTWTWPTKIIFSHESLDNSSTHRDNRSSLSSSSQSFLTVLIESSYLKMFISMRFLLLLIFSVALCLASGSNTDNQNFSSAISGTSLIRALTSIPRAIGNFLPMFFLFGLGALMVPALGLAVLLREGGMR